MVIEKSLGKKIVRSRASPMRGLYTPLPVPYYILLVHISFMNLSLISAELSATITRETPPIMYEVVLLHN